MDRDVSIEVKLMNTVVTITDDKSGTNFEYLQVTDCFKHRDDFYMKVDNESAVCLSDPGPYRLQFHNNVFVTPYKAEIIIKPISD